MSFLKKYLPYFNLLLLIIISFSLPLFQKVIPILISFFSFFILFDAIINKTLKLNNKTILITAILFFLIHLISVTYSSNKSIAWFDIEVKLSLIIFPILFLFKNEILQKNKKWVFISFIYGCIISSIMMLYTSYQHYNELGISAFYYGKIAIFHPSYIAMYFIFAIGILIKIMINKPKTIRYQILPFSAILLLLIMIFLFQSKAGILIMIVVSFYLLIISLLKLKSLLLKIAISILAISISFIGIQKSSRLNEMIKVVEQISKTGSSNDQTTGIRYEIWKLTVEKIKENPFFGIGAGDIKGELFIDYKKKNFSGALEKKLNVHNQFLETFLGQGIIGITLLLALFWFGFKEAHRRKNWLLTVFLILTFLSFGPESMLNTQAGVIFFSFFYFFLFQFTSEEDIIVT